MKQLIRLLSLLVLVGCGLPGALHAQTVLPPGEPLVAGDPLTAFQLSTMAGARDAVEFATIDAAGPGFTRAWRVATTRDVEPRWAIELRARIAQPVQAGDTALLRFHARSVFSADETGGAQLRIVAQKSGPDFQKSLEVQHTLGPEWREYLVPFAWRAAFAAEGAEVSLGFGFKRQTVEIGGLEVLHFGSSVPLADLPRSRHTYAGRDPEAAWRREALARIAQQRMGDFTIAVRDAAGRPVPGASVRVEQRRSAFQWGTAVQLARLVHDTPDNRVYREKLLEFFQAASPENDLKWAPWIGEWGRNYTREQSLAGLRWLRAQGLHTRGHVLVWPGWRNLPQAVNRLRGTPQERDIPRLVLERIAEAGAATRGLFDEWDVLNEPYDNHALMDLFGREIMVEWFKAAQATLPGLPLYLNDYANHDQTTDAAHVAHFEETAKFLLAQGAPLTGLGLQGHFGSQPNAPVQVLATLDRYAQLGLPIRITEFDITTEDEELQADYTRDFLILAYSHPAIVGVQFWGFWERAHWRASAAMLRADWSEKPAAAVYRALVLGEWRTRLAGATDPAGRYTGRGHHGDYVAIIEAGGQTTEHLFQLAPGAMSGAAAGAVVEVTLR